MTARAEVRISGAMRGRCLVVAVFGTALVAGCGGVSVLVRRDGQVATRTVRGQAQAAVDRASREIPCGLDQLTLEELGPGGYRVEGCDTAITYTCFRRICDPTERRSLATPASSGPVVVVTVSPTTDAAGPASSGLVAAGPAPGAVVGPDASARAAIDGRAPSLLACVEDDALSMQVSWTGEGRLDALLRGERQGTPEEACVRAIVQQLSIAAPGAPGTIVHAIQR